MIQYPAVLKRAQAEVDAMIGQDRMPNFEDRASLPYCDAVFTEALRWGAAVPLSKSKCGSSDVQTECSWLS